MRPCAILNWQFSVSFQAHVKSLSSYRMVYVMLTFICIYLMYHTLKFSALRFTARVDYFNS